MLGRAPAPPRACGDHRNLPAPFRAQHGCPRRPATQAAETSERGGVLVALPEHGTPAEHVGPFCWGVAALARRADRIRSFELFEFTVPVADEALSADAHEGALHTLDVYATYTPWRARHRRQEHTPSRSVTALPPWFEDA